MKFIADGMLGKLARWLRLAGHDVVYIGDLHVPPEQQDGVLLERAGLGGRELLTCDLVLHRRARKSGIMSILVEGKDVVSQLVEVFRRGGLRIKIDPERSRCPMCNGELESAGRENVREIVPEVVLRYHREFWRCAKCGKTYWQGKHWKTIIEMASSYNRLVE